VIGCGKSKQGERYVENVARIVHCAGRHQRID
jgi:hypothetical protein